MDGVKAVQRLQLKVGVYGYQDVGYVCLQKEGRYEREPIIDASQVNTLNCVTNCIHIIHHSVFQLKNINDAINIMMY